MNCEICFEKKEDVKQRNCGTCEGRPLCSDCWEKCGEFCPICEKNAANWTNGDNFLCISHYPKKMAGFRVANERIASEITKVLCETWTKQWVNSLNDDNAIIPCKVFFVKSKRRIVGIDNVTEYMSRFWNDPRTNFFYVCAKGQEDNPSLPLLLGSPEHPLEVYRNT